jgi:hypothetical protein
MGERQVATSTSLNTGGLFYIIFPVQFLKTHKLHTNEMHYILIFYSLTPTYVSAFTRPSSECKPHHWTLTTQTGPDLLH